MTHNQEWQTNVKGATQSRQGEDNLYYLAGPVAHELEGEVWVRSRARPLGRRKRRAEILRAS